MSIQNINALVMDYIGTNEIKNISSSRALHREKGHYASTRYHRGEAVLSAIRKEALYNLAEMLFFRDDYAVARIIRNTVHSVEIPFKFHVVEFITFLSAIIPLVLMCLDYFYSWTNLSVVFYLYVSACGASLYATSQVAKKEWKDRKLNEERKEKGKPQKN